jgi:peptidoglycan/LPS O-acetylase OafA/YrhL
VHPVATITDELASTTTFRALDGLRGVAVAAVIGFHLYRFTVIGWTAGGADVPVWSWPIGLGQFGVDVFFVLSGFLVVRSWASLRRKRPGWGGAAEFFRRRALRILPGFLVAVAVLTPLAAPELLAPSRWGDVALLASTQGYWKPGLVHDVNAVFWSLTPEVDFYLLVPVIAVVLAARRRWTLLAATLAVSVAWQAGGHGDLPAGVILGRVDQFVAGSVVATLFAAHQEGRRHPVVDLVRRPLAGWAMGLGILGLGIALGGALGPLPTGEWVALVHPAASLLFAGIILRLAIDDRPCLLAHPVLRYAGLVSYGVYLWHYRVLSFGFSLTGVRPGDGTPAVVVVALAVLLVAASMAVGTASYLLVERPFLRRRHAAAASGPAGPAGEGTPPEEDRRRALAAVG